MQQRAHWLAFEAQTLHPLQAVVVVVVVVLLLLLLLEVPLSALQQVEQRSRSRPKLHTRGSETGLACAPLLTMRFVNAGCSR
jgi:hypothetical protein